MKPFMDENFLLTTETAKVLYKDYAQALPIIDYHNHLSPKDIAEHRKFKNLFELWLETDHYKWRAMRANGVSEDLITGSASAYDKFIAWANVLPRLVGSPLYHWTHLELQRYFDIKETLSPETADAIWKKTREILAESGFDAVSLLSKMNVKVLCTTDDPADSLKWHQRIKSDSEIPFKVLPSFRPDRYLTDFPDNSSVLCGIYKTRSIKNALIKALDYFCDNGAAVSDHGFGSFNYVGVGNSFSDRMFTLGREYAQRDMVMQLHLEPIRNNSPALFKKCGPDAGCDSIGQTVNPEKLACFLGDLEGSDCLPRCILYNLNPADNAVISSMAGNFAPKVQFGAAWWFNDHLRGINACLDELMESGALAASVGMLTDSRSFTSFVRHEYFRRILCAKIGEQVENGLYPEDKETLGKIVSAVCYDNAASFFKF